MQCFYATRLKHGHARDAIKIDFRMTNGLVSNYEYCNGDGHMINSIDIPPPWCCNDSCDRFVGRLARSICSLSRLVTVLTDTWPPKFNESRIRADVAKRFLLVHRARLSSLGVDLQAYQLVDVPCQSLAILHKPTITGWCTLINPTTLLLLKQACDMSTACHLSTWTQFSRNHNLAMKTLYAKNSTIRYDTNSHRTTALNHF